MRLAKLAFRSFLVPNIVLSMMTTSLFAAEIDAAAILKCQAMQDDTSRLACYDDLNSPKPSAVEPATVDPAPAAPPPAEPVATTPPPVKTTPVESASRTPTDSGPRSAAPVPEPLNEEIGQQTLRGDGKKAKVLVRGRVVRCQQDLRKKYLFYFDNGQIWKQKDNKRIRWKECEFDVTISEDVFGYKMVPDGETKQVRIARVK
jgi:hypothetical protein